MPAPRDPSKNERPSTYFVQGRQNAEELIRLTKQEHLINTALGSILPEQLDPTGFSHVLDVGCGAGGWIIEAAQTYPAMSLVGIDISQRVIDFAREQAEAHEVSDRVEFHVMDALLKLDFSAAFFDLVNLRLSASFVRTWDWPNLLSEFLRVTRPDGVVRLTEAEVIPQSNSPALKHLQEMLMCALFRAGRLFAQESTGSINHLARLLKQYGCQQVQTKTYALEYQAGTPEGQVYREDVAHIFRTTRPFIQKWGCITGEYDAIYRQALEEMQQPDFHTTWKFLSAWGTNPRAKSSQP